MSDAPRPEQTPETDDTLLKPNQAPLQSAGESKSAGDTLEKPHIPTPPPPDPR